MQRIFFFFFFFEGVREKSFYDSAQLIKNSFTETIPVGKKLLNNISILFTFLDYGHRSIEIAILFFFMRMIFWVYESIVCFLNISYLSKLS